MKKNLIFIMALFFLSPNIFAYGVSENYTNYSIETKGNESNFKDNTNIESYNLKLREDILPIKPQQKKLKGNRKKNKKNISETGPGVTMIWIGLTIWAIGIFMMLLVSLLIGAILTIIGLIILYSGYIKFNKAKKGDEIPSRNAGQSQTTYKDVVYLKSGSMVKGIIIEQVPNVSLKIQTNDGSIFVYKMEEVEKITKEK